MPMMPLYVDYYEDLNLRGPTPSLWVRLLEVMVMQLCVAVSRKQRGLCLRSLTQESIKIEMKFKVAISGGVHIASSVQ